MNPEEVQLIAQDVSLPKPRQPRPILIIGAGGIVRAAHLPAYQKAGFPVIGLFDKDAGKAAALGAEFGVERSFDSIAEAVRFAPQDCVFDVAAPASQIAHILPELPDRAAVLMQKPMGETLEEAKRICAICRKKELAASVNFSLRYSPNNLVAAALAEAGLLGEIHDLEVQVATYTPWQLWTFLATAPRLEVLYHSIHYFDLIRSWLGNPRGVIAKTLRNPQTPDLGATKTVAILDYGDDKRVFVATNHHHNFGPSHQHSFVQWEGTAGAARMGMGLNLNYPKGKPDTLEYARRGSESAQWQALPLVGNNVPDGFIGTMGALQAYVEGSSSRLPTHYEDALQTMALVEAVYRADRRDGEPMPLDDRK